MAVSPPTASPSGPLIHIVAEAEAPGFAKALTGLHEAYRLVREQGLTFRDAYVQVGRNLGAVAIPDHDAVVRSRTHAGSTGNLGLDAIDAEAAAATTAWAARRGALESCWERLLAG